MTKRKPVESYSDCFRLFDLCLSQSGIRIPLPTAKAAIALRHRLYRARVRFVEATGSTRYNDIYLQIVYESGELQGPGNLLHPDSPCAIVMQLHSSRELPPITDLAGNPVQNTTPAGEEELDELEAAALDFKRKLIE